jgi:dephospho-CoA kinase
MNIGITGGIGSGKSRVCEALAGLLSASMASADAICRDLLGVNCRGWKEVRSFLGDEFFFSDGQLDRSRLRKALFSDSELRKQLNETLHPLVRDVLLAAAKEAKQQQRVFLAEVPLLFEKGWQSDFDWTVLVFAGEKICVRRVMLRDLVSEEDARLALAAQMPLQEKIPLADSVIDNSSSFTLTLLQLNQLSQMIRESNLFPGPARNV